MDDRTGSWAPLYSERLDVPKAITLLDPDATKVMDFIYCDLLNNYFAAMRGKNNK